MIVLLVHPVHGKMHVYDMGEVERNRKFGWMPEDEAKRIDEALAAKLAAESMSVYVSDPIVVRVHPEPDADAPLVLPVVDEPPKRKPGRPPKAK